MFKKFRTVLLLIPGLAFSSLAPVLAQEAPDPFELPSARNLWAPLENQEPGVVTDRVDVGGLRSMTPAHFGGFGTTWTQNTFELGSIDVTDPYSGGVSLIEPDPGALERIRVFTCEHDADTSSPGIVVWLVPRRGGTDPHGGADLYYADRNTQSRSLAGNERRAGITSPEHFGRFLQGGARLGGPLSSDGPTYFLSLDTDRLSRYPENVTEPESWNHTSGVLSLAGERNGHALGLYAILEHQHDSALGASPLQPPSSSPDSRSTDVFVSANDQFVVHGSSILVARLGYAGASVSDRFPSGFQRQSAIDLFEGRLSGAAPLATDGSRERFELALTGRRAVEMRPSLNGRDLPLSIDVSVGGGWKESASSNRYQVFDDVNLQFLQGQPSTVVLFDPGAQSRQRIRDLSLFLQTETRASDYFTLSAGVRLESNVGWLPGTSVGTVSWTSLSPRAAISVPAGSHFVFRASYARYAHELLGRDLEVVDPRALSGQVAVWNDASGDGQYQPGEAGSTLRVFGGRYSSLDPNLHPPVTDAFELSTQWRPSPRLGIEVTVRQRYEKDLLETVNTGVPASSYTPVSYVDPGGDGIVGTGDDRTITVYNQDPSTLGHDHFLLTNPRGFRAFYRSAQLLMRWSDAQERMRVEASFTAFGIVGEASQDLASQAYDEGVIGNLFDNPNTLIHADGRLFFDRGYLAKGWAFYRFPHDVTLGCVLKYFDGTPYARKIVVTGLNQGPFYVFATQRGNLTLVGLDPRNGPRTDYALTADLGVAKTFRVGTESLAVRLDVFNLLNSHTKTRDLELTGPTFQEAVETVAPRVARLGLTWAF